MSTVRREFPRLDILCYGLCRHSFLIYVANKSKPWLPRCLHQNSWMMLPRNIVEHYRFWPAPKYIIIYLCTYIYIYIDTYIFCPAAFPLVISSGSAWLWRVPLKAGSSAPKFGSPTWLRSGWISNGMNGINQEMIPWHPIKCPGVMTSVEERWINWIQLWFNKGVGVLFVFGIIAFKKWEGLHDIYHHKSYCICYWFHCFSLIRYRQAWFQLMWMWATKRQPFACTD